jgi:cell division FtsZ-interacting protein ZapD
MDWCINYAYRAFAKCQPLTVAELLQDDTTFLKWLQQIEPRLGLPKIKPGTTLETNTDVKWLTCALQYLQQYCWTIRHMSGNPSQMYNQAVLCNAASLLPYRVFPLHIYQLLNLFAKQPKKIQAEVVGCGLPFDNMRQLAEDMKKASLEKLGVVPRVGSLAVYSTSQELFISGVYKKLITNPIEDGALVKYFAWQKLPQGIKQTEVETWFTSTVPSFSQTSLDTLFDSSTNINVPSSHVAKQIFIAGGFVSTRLCEDAAMYPKCLSNIREMMLSFYEKASFSMNTLGIKP